MAVCMHRWLIEASFCSSYLPNVVPVATLDPMALCSSLRFGTFVVEFLIRVFNGSGPLGTFESIVPHSTQEASQMHVGELGVTVHLVPRAPALASEDIWREVPQSQNGAVLTSGLGSSPQSSSPLTCS